MEKELSEVRAKIDALDDELLALLRRRASLTADAGKIKQNAGAESFARPEREADILRRVSANCGAISDHSMRAIFREIISACLAVEKLQTVCYLGPPHTFTHEAARKHFGESAKYESADTVRAVFGRAEKGLCDFAVAPFENSGEGTVGDTFQMLMETPLCICGEAVLRVRHNLMTKAAMQLSDIEFIYAHPQAFAQCRKWLARHAPQAEKRATESNAAAARNAAEQGGKTAAIASSAAASHYGLQIAAADIEDSAFNSTRFLMLGKTPARPSAADKTSFIMHMAASDKAGVLYQLLEPMSRLGVNMTKFESRPARGKFGEYFFYVDIDGHQEDETVARALDDIRSRAAFVKILGSYPRGMQ